MRRDKRRVVRYHCLFCKRNIVEPVSENRGRPSRNRFKVGICRTCALARLKALTEDQYRGTLIRRLKLHLTRVAT